MTTRAWIPIAAALLAAPVQASAAPAEPAGDWTAWYGCWRAVETTADAGSLVCVLPGDEPATVRIATIEGDRITEETIVRADGVARPLEDGGCAGSESAFFSNDGRRIFTRAELACSGLGRLSTGVLAMVSESEWIDAQALTVNGQHAARTIRYRAADPADVPAWVAAELPQGQRLAQETARLDASTPLDIAAVIEASRHVASPAVEALLAERQQGFGLNAGKLVQLREQGVPASTIDVMVALSYPAKFAVEPRREYASDRADLEQNAARSWIEDCYDPYYSSRRYGCTSSRYGYGYGGRYGYSPYGYDPYGWNYGTRSRPVVVIVRPDDDDTARSGGSVVKGRGYRRTGDSNGTAAPRSATERRGDPTPVRATDRSSTATSTPSTSTTTRRTAKPRGNNNNNNNN
ncbi:MAG: hypothetical protein ACRELT_05650 [Longimicrobiales bacterium]